jgi:hypothetical protein
LSPIIWDAETVGSHADAEAGEAFIQAAKCAEKMKSLGERAGHYSSAGQCFKKVPDVERT